MTAILPTIPTSEPPASEPPASEPPTSERGVALLAVLFALTLLMLLALPFGVSMGAGADAAARDIDAMRTQQASASVRDLLLADAALSHPAFDETTYDALDEWPGEVVLPDALLPLAAEGRMTLGGSVEDLQRYLALDSVSPLVLANLLGTAVRLTAELLPDATAMAVDRTDRLPESGYVWIGHEVIRYGQKDGNRLMDLERGLFRDQGFVAPTESFQVQALVLDYRCVLACAWPHMVAGRSPKGPSQRVPYAAVTELASVAQAGIGAFTQIEIDRFTAALSVDAMADNSATWGRAERVFDGMLPGVSRTLRIKSALHLGAGSTVRLRDQKTGTVEHGLVMSVRTERSSPDLLLPSIFYLELLTPVTQAFSAVDTVVEPLVPSPVNINTAPSAVLSAIFEDVRRAADIRVHDTDSRERATPPRAITPSEAKALADEIEGARQGPNGGGPYTGWQNFVERVMRPRIEASANPEDRQRWIYFYRNLETGRDSVIEMGTAPITFHSGPWVSYRAAASLKRSTVASGVAARHERTGIAAAVPGFRLEHRWATQEQFEDAFQIDRRAPYWVTTPINLGALQPGDLGNDPAGRYFPHLVALAFGDMGFGAPRYASTEDVDAGVTPGTAIARHGNWVRALQGADSFAQTLSPRGHDLGRDGAYRMVNTGPSAAGGTPASGGRRHDRISFPFSAGKGFMQPLATQFWLEPQSLEGTTLFDHGMGDKDRNRLALHGRDGQLVLELLDEAGIDPDPSSSPAGVARTAVEINLPLAELGLPADTPVHLNVSAHTGKPGEITMHVDGMPRGKAKFTTVLTAAIDSFDPQMPNNRGLPPQSGDQRYFDMMVEDTAGFPPVGTLRVGLELFEYTSLTGNSFQCQWKDSIGGRGARQVSREHAPEIPVDSQGKPTVDINALQQQGVNLAVFPEHPVGAKVELYGYATRLAADSPMMVGTTRLGSAIGGFAVARAFLSSNPRPVGVALPQGGSFQVGVGIDENWTGDLELADPLQTGDEDPAAAQAAVSDAFPTTGGYALLLQLQFGFDVTLTQGAGTGSGNTGGMEVIRFTSRQGNKLRGVQRAQQIPGNDRTTPTADYDGTARKFVTKWRPGLLWDPPAPAPEFHDVTRGIVWVVPISIPVQSTSTLWDPQATGLTEWVQLYPEGGDVNDTEWVRYDAIVGAQHLVRGNRVAWERTRFELTRQVGVYRVTVGQNGNTTGPGSPADPWGTVQATTDFIGYTPRIEADFPQIHRVRSRLAFRGDMMLDFFQEGLNRTSSHAHSNSVVMQCQRLELLWGNYGALTGRPGRHDRIALIDGSEASGNKRPTVEWHTVNWCARRFDSDNLANNTTPNELLGPFPFQLIAFQDGVRGAFVGPPIGQINDETRSYDRIVKFPSGELPAAFCENVAIGSGVSNDAPVQGFVDEVEVVQHPLRNLIVDEAFNASARTFRINPNFTYNPSGAEWSATPVTAEYPQTGGLLLIDGEILAYQAQQDGQFTIATNGRGLLGTEARDHDRGAHVLFLTNRPAAILAGAVAARDDVLPLQALGALPPRGGTVRLGRELLHYSWVRVAGDQVSLEMPRWYPPGQLGTGSMARGLLRGRYGTAPSAGSSGEVVIGWPTRYWDRYAENSDDPELAYFQMTTTGAPSFFRSLWWREETRDSNVDVVCLVRTDSRAPWQADPATTPGLWKFTRAGDDDDPRMLSTQASRLEVRFATEYKSGAIDLVGLRAHGWKTAARVSNVLVDYEGEARIFDEKVTVR